MKLYKLLILISLISTRLYAIDNLTDKSWSEAFEAVHAKVKHYYPFTEYKKINLDSLYQLTSAAILEAEKTQNDTAFYKAMRQYAFAFPDNHVFMKRKGFNLYAKQMSGHYGFEITALDNGDVVVSQIRKGANNLPDQLKVGTKIISWNNKPIAETIQSTSLLMGERMDATAQNRFLKKCELLMYTPLGKYVTINVENKNGVQTQVNIKPSPTEDLKKAKTYPKVPLWQRAMESPVDFDILEKESLGYFQINGFMPNLNDYALAETFQEKLWLLKRLKIKNLIIDVRGNQGGVDKWAMKMAGHFVKEPKHYQYVSKFSDETGQFEIDSSLTNIVMPRKPYFGEQVVILVDNQTVSTGEGMPMVLQSLPNVIVIGQYSTAGSFAIGFAKFIFKMPSNIVFGFFEGRSLNKDGHIQVDANHHGIGGVSPDIKVPVTHESIKEQYVENKDYVREYAIDYLMKHHQ